VQGDRPRQPRHTVDAKPRLDLGVGAADRVRRRGVEHRLRRDGLVVGSTAAAREYGRDDYCNGG
jgi:hypothetical protein